jgi:hypothetical protein
VQLDMLLRRRQEILDNAYRVRLCGENLASWLARERVQELDHLPITQ